MLAKRMYKRMYKTYIHLKERFQQILRQASVPLASRLFTASFAVSAVSGWNSYAECKIFLSVSAANDI